MQLNPPIHAVGAAPANAAPSESAEASIGSVPPSFSPPPSRTCLAEFFVHREKRYLSTRLPHKDDFPRVAIDKRNERLTA